MHAIFSGLATPTIVAVLAFVAQGSAGAGEANLILAQTKLQQAPSAPSSGRPGSFAQPQKRAKKDCNGQTTEECCRGISYCTCLYPPTGGTKPLNCISNPP
jgi:hypothetical protein